jgi:hypothetical protein
VGKRPRGPQPDWQPSSPRAQGILADLIARYRQHEREGTLPRGGRGIFYDLRPNGMGNGVSYRKPDSAHPLSGFGPMEAHPAAVQEVLVMARRAGIIPEEWVADTRAPEPIRQSYWESAGYLASTIAGWAENASRSFRLDPQTHQPRYVELWCEAADLAPRVERIARPFGVPVYSGAGFDGLKGKRDVADRANDRELPTLILHIGDRDPHGELIFGALEEDVQAWAADRARWDSEAVELMDAAGVSEWLTFERLALTYDQAAQHGLLDADGKAEADSLPVQVLDDIVTTRLNGLLDDDARDRWLADEAELREELPTLVRQALRDAGLI